MADVHVIDTSSLIQFLDDLSPAPLWRVLVACEQWVVNGRLVFPTQVERELRSYGVPDSITAWCAGVKDRRRFDDPDYKTVRQIMSNSVLQRVVDWGKSTKADPADPYVLAQAVEIQAAGHEVCIVNEDRRDKNDGYGKLKKSSIHTCCAQLNITSMVTSQFLPLLGVKL